MTRSRYFVTAHPSRPNVAVDIDADGVATLCCSGKVWRFREGQRGLIEEVSGHLASATGREDARELALLAFEARLAEMIEAC